jgi:hypothetical protein
MGSLGVGRVSLKEKAMRASESRANGRPNYLNMYRRKVLRNHDKKIMVDKRKAARIS